MLGVTLALLVIQGLRYAFLNPETPSERTAGVGTVEMVLNEQERGFSGETVAGHAPAVNLF